MPLRLEQGAAMNEIHECLQEIRIGEVRRHRNLALAPLFGADLEPWYAVLEAVLGKGLLRIEEVSEAGSVPELRLVNEGSRPVLLLDGEEVSGAKQNRIINVTVLAAAGRETVIPVSCVEAGRWHRTSREFEATDRALYARARRGKAARVSESMRAHGSRRSDQQEIWSDIAAKSAAMRAHSPTGAAEAIYRRHDGTLDGFVAELPWIPGQTGAAFLIDGRIAGLDLFDSAETQRRYHPRLVRSYALDALESSGSVDQGDVLPAVDHLIGQIFDAGTERFPGVGLGEDLRFSGPVAGGALVAEGHVVHLCAFSSPDRDSQETRERVPGLQRASARRRLHRS